MSRLVALLTIVLFLVIGFQDYKEVPELLADFQMRDQALNGVKAAAVNEQQIVERIHRTLLTLSQLPAIRTKDHSGCSAYLDTIRSLFPALISFLITDVGGDPICHLDKNYRPITIADQRYFQAALKMDAFTVGEFTTSLSTGENIVQFALPFHDKDGRVAGVIVSALSLDWLAAYVARSDITEGAVLAVMDETGTYLARSSENDRFVGTKKPEWKRVKLDEQSTIDTLDVDGINRVEAFSAVPAGAGRLVISFGVDRNAAAESLSRNTGLGVRRSIVRSGDQPIEGKPGKPMKE